MTEQRSEEKRFPLLSLEEVRVFKPQPERVGESTYNGILYGHYFCPIDGSRFSVMESDHV